MKLKAKLSGHNGNESYEAGDTLEGNTEHHQFLLFNGVAEPLDKEAKDFVAKREEMKPKDVQGHRMHNPDLVKASTQEVVKVKKAKKSRVSKKSKW